MNNTQSGAFGRKSYANAEVTNGRTAKGPWTVTVVNANPDMGYFQFIGNAIPAIGNEAVSANKKANNYANASVTGGSSATTTNTYANGTSLKINAIAKTGYEFVGFVYEGKTYGSPLSLTVNKNMYITASFRKKADEFFTVSLTANDPKMGSVSGAGEYKKGTTIRLTATPKDGYKFIRWQGHQFAGNYQDNTSRSIEWTVSKNLELVAIFETASTSTDPETPINETPSNGGGVETPGNGSVGSGTGSGSGTGNGSGTGSGSGTGNETTTYEAEQTTQEKAIAFVKKNWIMLLLAAIVLYKIYKSKKK